jgi:hypothetical protein
VIDWRFTGFIPGSPKNMRHRKESIDEAIFVGHFWIASSLPLLAMTALETHR